MAVVPATFQVTFCVDPAAQLTIVFGVVITNGPAVPLTVTFIKSDTVCPPPALLSLTVNEKFKSLATEGQTSQVFEVAPVNTVAKLGINRVDETALGRGLNIGPTVLVGDGAAVVFGSCGSFCSQLYVMASPSGSEAVPVNMKAVNFGIT